MATKKKTIARNTKFDKNAIVAALNSHLAQLKRNRNSAQSQYDKMEKLQEDVDSLDCEIKNIETALEALNDYWD